MEKSKRDDDALLKAQAEVEQYKRQGASNTNVMKALTRSGARLIQLKPTEAAGKGLAYAIVVPKFGLVLVGSNLPKPADHHTFQFWILRNESPEQVAVGFMPPDSSGTWIAPYEDTSLLASMTGVLVTEEPVQKADEKPGPKIFEATTTVEPN